MRSAALSAALVTALLALSGCGGEAAQRLPRDARHVHGLGVNPADGAVVIATHSGMFRLQNGSVEPIGSRVQDTMGLTVVGPDHFLGSGHPDFYKDPDYPPILGLVESRNAGRTWEPRSLLGSADLHVLRVQGRVVVAYDVSKDRLLISRDRGATWRTRRVSASLVDLVIDPTNPARFLATSGARLLGSSDGGQTWRSIVATTGLLAWPARDHLYLLGADGRLWWTPDLGRRWQARATIGDRPTAFNVSGNRLLAAGESGRIMESRDGGRTWRLLATLRQ